MNDEGAGLAKAYVGLPPTVFLYTVDQIATMLSVPMSSMSSRVWYKGRTTTRRLPRQLVAINISPPHMQPDWRISEVEFIRFCKAVGVRLHRRS